jgi:cobalamin biosynthesis Mg chelatase CobN
MKRQILTFAAALAITAAPALFAQSTLNTTAPGPSQETKPGQTNNNLQNPGGNMQQPNQNGTFQEHGTVEGSANESVTGTNDANNGTGTSTGVTGTTGTPQNQNTGTTTGTMSNGSTGSTTGTTTGTTGTMNNMDNSGTTGSGTTGSYSGSTGSSYNSTGTTGTSGTSTGTSGSLPRTASDLPTVALAGLLALIAAFAVRVYSKRNA